MTPGWRALSRAIETRERPLRHPLVVHYGRHELTIRQSETRRIVETARQRSGTHNARRALVERMLARTVVRAWRQAEDRAAHAGTRLPVEKDEAARVAAGMASELRRDPNARAALERMWPLLSPEELIHDLFGAPALLRAAAEDLLTGEEMSALARERSATLAEIPWTEADIALLDEAAQLLGPAKREGSGPQRRHARRGRGLDARPGRRRLHARLSRLRRTPGARQR